MLRTVGEDSFMGRGWRGEGVMWGWDGSDDRMIGSAKRRDER